MQAMPTVLGAAGPLTPGSNVALGITLIVIFGWWAIWPRSVIAVNQWLLRFKVIRRLSQSPAKSAVEPDVRRVRVVSRLAFVIAIGVLVVGILRL